MAYLNDDEDFQLFSALSIQEAAEVLDEVDERSFSGRRMPKRHSGSM
jgi:hypothetical protein